MFRRKKTSRTARFVKRIRGYYMFCKLWLAEKVAVASARKYKKLSKRDKKMDKYFYSGLKGRFACWWVSQRLFLQAAICRYARRTGTYKNL